MVLKFYGHPNTTCSRRVATILYEMRIPYEFYFVDIAKGEQKTPEHLEKHPFGLVPFIDDDGFILYESRAICRYLAIKYANQGPKLIPDASDLKATALFEQAASSEIYNFDFFSFKAVYENVLKKLHGHAPDTKAFNEAIETLDAKLKAYDAILGKQKYLAGDDLTVIDLFHLPNGALLSDAGSNIMSQRLNVTRWWNDISSRPSWTAVAQGIPPEPTF
ncbi:hypothetical protein VNI00_007909 [Paramarasmius palmivorus]|uniref:glutathione transferase n=1 Tax=Paramarasmius palmivorus TaxID=297713 RepID=A0AAW0CY11_9AGAR